MPPADPALSCCPSLSSHELAPELGQTPHAAEPRQPALGPSKEEAAATPEPGLSLFLFLLLVITRSWLRGQGWGTCARLLKQCQQAVPCPGSGRGRNRLLMTGRCDRATPTWRDWPATATTRHTVPLFSQRPPMRRGWQKEGGWRQILAGRNA